MYSNLTIKIPAWLDCIFAAPLLLYRQWKFGYPFRRIYLGEGKFTIVDPPDFYRFNKYHWCLKQNGPRIYAVRLICDSNNKTKILSLHREILNAPAHLLVDHANRNTLDNRQANIRLATHSENQFNKGKTSANTSSKYVGVFREKRTGKWVARIVFNKKRIWLGRFPDELDAARAYDEAAKKYHKEFARLNFNV